MILVNVKTQQIPILIPDISINKISVFFPGIIKAIQIFEPSALFGFWPQEW